MAIFEDLELSASDEQRAEHFNAKWEHVLEDMAQQQTSVDLSRFPVDENGNHYMPKKDLKKALKGVARDTQDFYANIRTHFDADLIEQIGNLSLEDVFRTRYNSVLHTELFNAVREKREKDKENPSYMSKRDFKNHKNERVSKAFDAFGFKHMDQDVRYHQLSRLVTTAEAVLSEKNSRQENFQYSVTKNELESKLSKKAREEIKENVGMLLFDAYLSGADLSQSLFLVQNSHFLEFGQEEILIDAINSTGAISGFNNRPLFPGAEDETIDISNIIDAIAFDAYATRILKDEDLVTPRVAHAILDNVSTFALGWRGYEITLENGLTTENLVGEEESRPFSDLFLERALGHAGGERKWIQINSLLRTALSESNPNMDHIDRIISNHSSENNPREGFQYIAKELVKGFLTFAQPIKMPEDVWGHPDPAKFNEHGQYTIKDLADGIMLATTLESTLTGQERNVDLKPIKNQLINRMSRMTSSLSDVFARTFVDQQIMHFEYLKILSDAISWDESSIRAAYEGTTSLDSLFLTMQSLDTIDRSTTHIARQYMSENNSAEELISGFAHLTDYVMDFGYDNHTEKMKHKILDELSRKSVSEELVKPLMKAAYLAVENTNMNYRSLRMIARALPSAEHVLQLASEVQHAIMDTNIYGTLLREAFNKAKDIGEVKTIRNIAKELGNVDFISEQTGFQLLRDSIEQKWKNYSPLERLSARIPYKIEVVRRT